MSISNKDLELKFAIFQSLWRTQKLQHKVTLRYITQHVLTGLLHFMLWVALENHIIVINPTKCSW